mmetsp:Transcript_25418/g.76396  ORF Transcript_25418/g.76396 Transcript_25418/m.76396 type:complete len:212 (+) Transcript_25418:431-1066(+)
MKCIAHLCRTPSACGSNRRKSKRSMASPAKFAASCKWPRTRSPRMPLPSPPPSFDDASRKPLRLLHGVENLISSPMTQEWKQNRSELRYMCPWWKKAEASTDPGNLASSRSSATTLMSSASSSSGLRTSNSAQNERSSSSEQRPNSRATSAKLSASIWTREPRRRTLALECPPRSHISTAPRCCSAARRCASGASGPCFRSFLHRLLALRR